MMNKIKLGILAGGSSIEREVSLKSCSNILESIDSNKYDVTVFNIVSEKDGNWLSELKKNPPDIIVSALHGGLGENGSMQGLLHCLDIPYIGSRVMSSALCMDKKSAKTLLEANHIQTAHDIFIKRGESADLYADEIRQIGFPLIVKPNRGGSSIGIEIVNSIEELNSAVKHIVEKYNDDVIAEKLIKGREITCCVAEDNSGIQVMAVLDVNKKGEIFNYEDKYESGISSALTDMPSFMQDMVTTIAKRTFRLLKCRGYACVDMFVDEEQIFVIEVNTLPGLTKNSIVPAACKSIGISFGDFLDRMIEFELNN